MLKEEIEKILDERWEEIHEYLWKRSQKKIEEIIKAAVSKHESYSRRSNGKRVTGRPPGSKKWGAVDPASVVRENSKIAPVSLGCYPRGMLWSDAVARCGTNRLIEPVSGPQYSPPGDYYAHVNAPWKHEAQPFDVCDLAIAKLLYTGPSNPLQMTRAYVGEDRYAPVLKFADSCRRFKAFELAGLAVFDPDNTSGHSGKFRPRWYRATAKLEDIMIMM